MNLFDYLNFCIPTDFTNNLEKIYFDKNSYYLTKFSCTKSFANVDKPFDYIKANAVIHALKNKERIEYTASLLNYQNINDSTINVIHHKMPFFIHKKKKIYVPIFSSKVNERYNSNISQLSSPPFIILRSVQGTDKFYNDPFLTYKNEIFDSTFTSLIKIMVYDNLTVYYSVDFSQIYIITDQGTLDCTIPLFDNKLIEPNRENLSSRIIELLKPYFDFDKNEFIEKLYKLDFVSDYLYKQLKKKV